MEIIFVNDVNQKCRIRKLPQKTGESVGFAAHSACIAEKGGGKIFHPSGIQEGSEPLGMYILGADID